ncbi:MAG: dimethylarginine dimethylaminohydrolase family protein [Limnochordia bacterium]|jgi:N-dimethylarginine dimethylaminohydrolase
MRVYLRAEELDFTTANLQNRLATKRILMCTPDYFDVTEAINEFMYQRQGDAVILNKVDRSLAVRQWNYLKDLYCSLGYQVELVSGPYGLEDAVFCANQSFPFLNPQTGEKEVIMSIMRKEKRKKEVAYFEAWYRNAGYRIHHLHDCCFEAQGDAVWFPGKNLIISGYGSTEYHRTDLEALRQVAAITGIPVIGIHLTHKDFYHLNTALCLVSPRTCVVYPDGVGEEGMQVLRRLFQNVIEVPRQEAYAPHFACNAFSPDGRVVLIQHSCVQTISALEELGYIVLRVDTSEYIKSGGSVFCMKMMVY